MRHTFNSARLAVLLGLFTLPTASLAQDSSQAADLAKQLSNPISSLISVPFQWNYDQNLGPDGDGVQRYTRFQPVLPISLNDNWNLITRMIVTYYDQDDVTGPGQKESGFGDTSLSFFFSPKAETDGWTWGAGPIISIPSHNDTFSTDQWGAGLTGVALKQQHGWTYGMLASQTWGINPPDNESGFSTLFLQPFLSYSTPTAWTFGVNSETVYNWNSEEWSVPINAFVAKVVHFGKQPIQFEGGLRYWADSPQNGAQDIGYRLQVNFLFPKK